MKITFDILLLVIARSIGGRLFFVWKLMVRS
jgi:hypothetical protein